MSRITVEKKLSPEKVTALGVETWGRWGCEVSRFPWTYESTETCYLFEGEVEVVAADGERVTIAAGDLATFPSGLSCEWNVIKPVRKAYRFS